METKICNVCKNEIPLSGFLKLEGQWLSNQCHECLKKKGRDRYWKNHARYKKTARAYAKTRDPEKRYWKLLKYKFNMSDAKSWYEMQLTKQNGRCAICESKTNLHRKHFCADHNHGTNKVRGLLCSWCNRMLGYAKDNPKVLDAGAKYLKSYQDTLTA